MEKFINNETTEYLKSLQGNTTQDQINQLAMQVAEVVTYLGDFETYVDGQHTEQTRALMEAKAQILKEQIIAGRRVEELRKRLTILVYVAAVSSFVVLGMGVGLWLTK